MNTFVETKFGPTVGLQETTWLLPSLIANETAPIGCSALATPVTVAVRVDDPPNVGLVDATKLMVGVCWLRVTVNEEEDAAE